MIKEKNGFTMMDLVMVIAILSIFSVMAIPRLTSLHTVKLYGVANKLASDIQYAQQIAISKQIPCGISFNPGTDSYFVYEGAYSGPTTPKATDPYTRGAFIVDYQSEAHYKGIDLASTSFGDRLEFDSLGRPYNSGGILTTSSEEVELQSGGETRKVLITPNTGAIRVQ